MTLKNRAIVNLVSGGVKGFRLNFAGEGEDYHTRPANPEEDSGGMGAIFGKL